MNEIEKVPEVRPDEVLLQKTERLGEVDRVPGGCEIEAEAGRLGQFAGDVVPDGASNGRGEGANDLGDRGRFVDLVVGSGNEAGVNQ